MKEVLAGYQAGIAPVAGRRNLFFMCWMIFWLSVGEGFTAPAIPLLGKGLGAAYWQLGLLMTGYGAAYTVMTLTAGQASDRTGRKIMLVLSLGLSVVASAGYVLSGSVGALLAFRTLEGLSRGMLWPVSEATIADHAGSNHLARAMSFFTAAYGSGVTLGTLAGGWVMARYGLQAVFPLYPALGLLTLTTTIWGVEDVSGLVKKPALPGRREEGGWERVRPLWPVGVVGFAYAGFLYSIWALLSALASEVGVAAGGIGGLFSLFWGARTAMFLAGGAIAIRAGSRRALLAGLLLCTMGAGALLAARSMVPLLLAALLAGTGTGLVFPLSLVLVTERTNAESRGFGMGFLELCMGLGMVAQTALAGMAGQWAGIGWTYLSLFVANILAMITSCFTFRNGQPAGD